MPLGVQGEFGEVERETGLESATFSLEGRRSLPREPEVLKHWLPGTMAAWCDQGALCPVRLPGTPRPRGPIQPTEIPDQGA